MPTHHRRAQNQWLLPDRYFKIHTVRTITAQYILRSHLILWHFINREILIQVTRPKNRRILIISNQTIQLRGIIINLIQVNRIEIIGESKQNMTPKNPTYINIVKVSFLQLENLIIKWINYSLNLIRTFKKWNKKFIICVLILLPHNLNLILPNLLMNFQHSNLAQFQIK